MQLNYIIPEGQYFFFRQLVRPLTDRGVQVHVNSSPAECDINLAAILPVTHEWYGRLEGYWDRTIVWHWDLYSFTDYTEPRWANFLRILPSALDVWSCTYEVARELKQYQEQDSYVVPAWVAPDCAQTEERALQPPYAVYAASSDHFGKRANWAERACKVLQKELVVLRGQNLARKEYLQTLARASVYIMPASEESNGSIPAMEAAAMDVPVVITDLPASREVFGDDAYYFQPNDFRGLLNAINRSEEPGAKFARDRIIRNYYLPVVARRIHRRLEQLYAELQTRPR